MASESASTGEWWPHQNNTGSSNNENCDFDYDEFGEIFSNFLDPAAGGYREETVVDQVESSGPPDDIPLQPLVKCEYCRELFEAEEFDSHMCQYNEQGIYMDHAREEMADSEILEEGRKALQDIETYGSITIPDFIREVFFPNDSRKKSTSGSHTCKICDKKFVHASGLLRHEEKHSLDLIPVKFKKSETDLYVVFICGFCSELFLEQNQAVLHVKSHHDEVIVAPDPNCTEEEIDYFVQLCQNIIPEYAKMIKEEEISMTVLSEPFQCEFCEKLFFDAPLLLHHEGTHLSNSAYQCLQCNEQFRTVKDLQGHRRTTCKVYAERIKSYPGLRSIFVCNICTVECSSLEQLCEHRSTEGHLFPRINSQTGEFEVVCCFCGIVYNKHSTAVKHFNDSHKPKTVSLVMKYRQYLCDVCGKTYTQSSHLWQHLRFHQGIKPFFCHYEGCERKFTIRPDLNDHIRKCHTKERPYHCEECNKSFLTGSVYYQHRLIHRGERRYGCDDCGKRFYRADALKNHQRIHTGEKPYACQYCPKHFRQRGDRDKHIRARHSEFANLKNLDLKQVIKPERLTEVLKGSLPPN